MKWLRHVATGLCRNCSRQKSLHCPECGSCPTNACPYWCALNDDPYSLKD